MENKTAQTQKTNVDVQNLNNVKKKISLKKESLELIQKEGKETRKGISNKSIYKNVSHLGTEDQKTFRGKIRRELRNFVSQILGKDRQEKERIEGIENFLEFYKKHWSITDFKIENFTLSRNASDLKDYSMLLRVVKESME